LWISLKRGMSTSCGKRKLRGLYQIFQPPTRVARQTTRNRELPMSSPQVGTNGRRKLIPLLGEFSRDFLNDYRNFRRTDAPLVRYVGCLIVSAVSIGTALITTGYGIHAAWGVLALAGVAAVAERASVRVNATTEASISLVPTVFAAVVFGPLAAMVVGAASMLGDFQRPRIRWVAYTCSRAITAAAAGLAAISVSMLSTSVVGTVGAATVAAAVTAEGLDVAFAAMINKLRRKGGWIEAVWTLVPMGIGFIALYAPLIAVLAVAYRELTPWTLALFFVPALAAQRLFVLYQEQRRLTDDLVCANQQLERAGLSFASALVATLDARDRYTAGHSAAVAGYARDIAARMGLSPAEQQLAHLCGLVHDIGKVGLPPGLLEKPGPLSLQERRVMEEHPVIGQRILEKVENYEAIATVVRHHHERIDGHGYPDCLIGNDIPLISRILAVADAYDAMTSDRPYRDAMPSHVARLRLAQAVESQFDTAVVAAFEAILATAPHQHRGESLASVTSRTREPALSAAAS
jgi:putative nucleotidyltransferase with HDIG domain